MCMSLPCFQLTTEADNRHSCSLPPISSLLEEAEAADYHSSWQNPVPQASYWDNSLPVMSFHPHHQDHDRMEGVQDGSSSSTTPLSSIEDNSFVRTMLDRQVEPSYQPSNALSRHVSETNSDDADSRDQNLRNTKKARNTKADREKHQCHYQAFEDLLRINCGYAARTPQTTNNGTSSGLQGNKNELLTIAFVVLELLTSMGRARAVQNGGEEEWMEMWRTIFDSTWKESTNPRSEFKLPRFSILHGEDNRRCRYDVRRKETRGKNGLTCVTHGLTFDGYGHVPVDFRACRFNIRSRNAHRNMRRLLTCDLNHVQRTWLGMDTSRPRL